MTSIKIGFFVKAWPPINFFNPYYISITYLPPPCYMRYLRRGLRDLYIWTRSMLTVLGDCQDNTPILYNPTKLSNQLCTESKELMKGNLLKNLLVLPLSREKNPSTAFLFPKVSCL